MSGPLASSSSRAWGLFGQDRLVSDFRRAVIAGPRHAYILAGAPQSGRRTLAVAFAKALNCLEPPAPGEFCGHCGVCRRIARGVFPDVSIFDLSAQAERERASGKNLTLTIATVREVTSQVAYRPSEARWRVVIIDDVESMQDTAQEAFLKTLEEPPPYAVILLLTTDADVLLPTIRSRCVTVRMQVANASAVEEALLHRGVTEDDSTRIAALSNGRVGWAMTAAADRTVLERALEEEKEAAGWLAAGAFDRLVRAWMLAEEFAKDRESVYRKLHAVQRAWRGILYRRHGVAATGTIAQGDMSPDMLTPLSGLSIARAMASVDECITDLEANVRPRLALQTMVISWPDLPR